MYLNLFDIPVLVIVSFVITLRDAKVWKKKNPDLWYILSVGIVFVFWVNALLAALHVITFPWGHPLGAAPMSRWVALLIVLSYPLWYNWSAENALRFFGRNPYQEGLVWPFTKGENSEPFQPAWKSPESDRL